MSCVWERGHIACNTWKKKMKNLLGTDYACNTEFPRLNWTESLSAKRLPKCGRFWGVNNFWPSISWQERLKMAGHPEMNDIKKEASLIFWSLVAIKTGHETAASPWHHNDILNNGNHLHLIIITQWWQTFELASLSISWSSLQLRLIGLGSDHRFADGLSNSPTETEN